MRIFASLFERCGFLRAWLKDDCFLSADLFLSADVFVLLIPLFPLIPWFPQYDSTDGVNIFNKFSTSNLNFYAARDYCGSAFIEVLRC